MIIYIYIIYVSFYGILMYIFSSGIMLAIVFGSGETHARPSQAAELAMTFATWRLGEEERKERKEEKDEVHKII